MKQGNVVQAKSYQFVLEIVKTCQWLVDQKKERIISQQLLRSGTSIGANVEEAIGGQSKRDFQSKLRISYKEARETHYWLRLLRDVGYFQPSQSKKLIVDSEELLKILSSILKTLQSSN
ncbi:MAG: four helix bundle protein [Bacteroidota bacterium]